MAGIDQERVTMRERLTALVVLGTAVVGAYCYLNVAPVFTPGTLPMTALDQAIPFILWTVWPYVGLNVSNAVMPFFVHKRSNFRQLVVTLSIAMAISILFWLFWPISFARPDVPTANTASAYLYRALIQVDQPLNCFPSAHIAGPAVQLIFVTRENPKLKFALWGIFGLAALTVLTTKQHYGWDVLGAVALVLFSYKLGERIVSRWPSAGGTAS